MMEVEPGAQRLLEDYTRSVAERSGLPEPQRSDARQELYSHLYEVAQAKATDAASPHATYDHARAAIRSLGTADEVDKAFFAPFRANVERAPLMTRAVAYIIDIILVAIGIAILEGPLRFLFWAPWYANGPWGYDPSGLMFFILAVGYFAAFEVTTGQTPGKMVLKLRAVGGNGGPLDWNAGILRNLTKGFPPLALLDAVLGHFADKHQPQRLSERYVQTAVVREEAGR